MNSKIFLHIKKRIRFRKFLVATVNFKNKSEFSDTIFIFEKKGSQLNISDKIENFFSDSDISAAKKLTGLPLYIHFSGTGIMTREAKNHTTLESIQNFMPGFQVKDYIVQINNLQNESSIINIIRKDQINVFFDRAKTKNIYTTGIFLSLYPVIPLAGNFSDFKDKVDIGELCLFFEKGAVTGIGKGTSNEAIFFMEEKRDLDTLYALSCAVQVSVSPGNHTYNHKPLVEGLTDVVYFKSGNHLIRFGVAAVFAILFINYLCFDYLLRKHNDMALQIETRENMLTNLSQIQDDLNNKMIFISENDLESNIFPSYLSDQIGILTPEGINLTELVINPLQRKIKTNESIQFNNGEIHLSGLSRSVESYRRFIASVEEVNWCDEISFQDYHYEPGSKNAQFQLHIKVKPANNNMIR